MFEALANAESFVSNENPTSPKNVLYRPDTDRNKADETQTHSVFTLLAKKIVKKIFKKVFIIFHV